MENKITITDFEDKKGKDSGKRYTRFLTNLGWCSCFDADISAELKKHENKDPICVKIQEKGDYKNITHIIPDDGSISETKVVSGNITPSTGTKDASYYTAYAKDIFINLRQMQDIITDNVLLMNQAIDLVKQARTAFS